MALTLLIGRPRSGKSCTATNYFALLHLVYTDRPLYTNLPLNLEEFVECAARKRLKYQQLKFSVPLLKATKKEIFERITLVENDEVRPVLDQETGAEIMVAEKDREGNETGKMVNLVASVIREFWYFSQPASLVLFDESADIWNARDFKALSRTKLQSYINHHGHYDDDLLIMAHNRNDIDKQLRTKAETIWICRNSLREPIVPFRFLSMICWPVQCFLMKGHQQDEESSALTVTQSFIFWPRAWCFKNYVSKSKPNTIAGKAMNTDKKLKGSDRFVWRDWWREFIKRTKYLWILLFFVGTIGYSVIKSGMAFLSGEMSFFGDRGPVAVGGSDSSVPPPVGPPPSPEPELSPSEESPPKGVFDSPPGQKEEKKSSSDFSIILVTSDKVVCSDGTWRFDDLPKDRIPLLLSYLGQFAPIK